MKLEGKVDRYAPVNIDGEMNLLAATVYSDIKMSFKGLELTTMTPYSGRFAGYKIDKGKLSVDLTYKIEQRKLTAEQHFVIDQLQLGRSGRQSGCGASAVEAGGGAAEGSQRRHRRCRCPSAAAWTTRNSRSGRSSGMRSSICSTR